MCNIIVFFIFLKRVNGTRQGILTTGYGKFPQEFEVYIIECFSKKDGNYILKSKSAICGYSPYSARVSGVGRAMAVLVPNQ
jgi:hypothetical protein